VARCLTLSLCPAKRARSAALVARGRQLDVWAVASLAGRRAPESNVIHGLFPEAQMCIRPPMRSSDATRVTSARGG